MTASGSPFVSFAWQKEEEKGGEINVGAAERALLVSYNSNVRWFIHSSENQIDILISFKRYSRFSCWQGWRGGGAESMINWIPLASAVRCWNVHHSQDRRLFAVHEIRCWNVSAINLGPKALVLGVVISIRCWTVLWSDIKLG